MMDLLEAAIVEHVRNDFMDAGNCWDISTMSTAGSAGVRKESQSIHQAPQLRNNTRSLSIFLTHAAFRSETEKQKTEWTADFHGLFQWRIVMISQQLDNSMRKVETMVEMKRIS